MNHPAKIRAVTALTAAFILCLATAPAKAEVTEMEAVQGLHGHLALVEARKAALDDLYYSAHAPATLSDAFAARGVDFATRYAQSWGGSIWLAWNSAQVFYDNHATILRDSVGAVRVRGLATARQYVSLERGMRSWTRTQSRIADLMAEITGLYADLGLLSDRHQA